MHGREREDESEGKRVSPSIFCLMSARRFHCRGGRERESPEHKFAVTASWRLRSAGSGVCSRESPSLDEFSYSQRKRRPKVTRLYALHFGSSECGRRVSPRFAEEEHCKKTNKQTNTKKRLKENVIREHNKLPRGRRFQR